MSVAFASACFLLSFMTFAVAQQVDYRASVGCRDAKVDIVDDMTLAQYEQYVRDRRCKCLNICDKPSLETTGGTLPTFRIYESYDLEGGDYRRINDVSQQTCSTYCGDDRRCIAFAWDKWNRVCFLKDRVPGSLRVDPQSVSVVLASARQPNVWSAPVVIERFRNAEFRDAAFNRIQGSSFERCQSACENNARCEAFSYVKGPQLCKLINKPDEYFRLNNNAVDSGVKRQSAPR